MLINPRLNIYDRGEQERVINLKWSQGTKMEPIKVWARNIVLNNNNDYIAVPSGASYSREVSEDRGLLQEGSRHPERIPEEHDEVHSLFELQLFWSVFDQLAPNTYPYLISSQGRGCRLLQVRPGPGRQDQHGDGGW